MSAERLDKGRDDMDIIKQYIECAKSFVQLSSAALVIPVALKTKVFGIPEGGRRFEGMELVAVCVSWALFLVAIGAGAFYQYAATKFVEYTRSPQETFLSAIVKPFVKGHGPGVLYGVMVVAFFCGALCVVLYSLAMIMR